MPVEGWSVITVKEPLHDRAADFVKKLNQGKRYKDEKISLGDFAETANFIPSAKITLSATSGSVAPRGSVKVTATIKGAGQIITLSHGTLPSGISVSFATNPITDSISGVADAITISASSSAVPGTYHISITASGADGQKSTITYTLTVT
jgi:hypothetical protein